MPWNPFEAVCMHKNARKKNAPDRAWVRLLLSNDRDAGERFVTAYYPRIERMLRYLTSSADIAHDLTQQTFVKAWQALPGFRNESGLGTWLHRIAYHEYTHWLRSRRDHAPLEAAEHIPGPSIDNDWGMALLPNALAQLTDDLRETFLLHYVQELSVQEVADVLAVPKGTVKSRLFTARAKLREILQAAEQEAQAQMAETPRYEIPAQYRVQPNSIPQKASDKEAPNQILNAPPAPPEVTPLLNT